MPLAELVALVRVPTVELVAVGRDQLTGAAMLLQLVVEVVLRGFGTGDNHQNINSFAWSPGSPSAERNTRLWNPR